MVLIKDRLSKVVPAQALFEQLAWRKPEVEIELEFLEAATSAVYSYGLLLPTNFPIYYLGKGGAAGAMQALSRLAFGNTLLGVGIANAQVFANMTRSNGRILLATSLRSTDGASATFKVGDKYPILSGGFLGGGLGLPPAFNYEDLGLTLKVTPRVHGEREMTLELSAEFKVLGGQAFNGIPVISNRKFESKARLRDGEWAVVAGMMTTRDARTITGPALLANLPLLGRIARKDETDRGSTEVVLVIKPHLLSLPPGEFLSRALHLGSEGRLQIPL
jgi:type II secretory pathway component GspD/PulD (secretin)